MATVVSIFKRVFGVTRFCSPASTDDLGTGPGDMHFHDFFAWNLFAVVIVSGFSMEVFVARLLLSEDSCEESDRKMDTSRTNACARRWKECCVVEIAQYFAPK